MAKLEAKEGKWLYNGEVFAKSVTTYGDTTKWVEVTDEYKVSVEGNAELAEPIANKIAEIDKYDQSSSVNSFTYQGQEYWLDKDTRVGLVNSTNMLKSIGQDRTTLWLNDISMTLPCDAVLYMLCTIEVYALQCYNTTAQHKSNVRKLQTIEEVEAYDYTIGYPSKLEF